MYSEAALRVSTLLGLWSGGIRGTMLLKRENMVFKFLIYGVGKSQVVNKCFVERPSSIRGGRQSFRPWIFRGNMS